ncbi:MAG: LicD family protein, partial [Eubacterium sp.]|nr:LicD family protein [Eubacterium sp.]
MSHSIDFFRDEVRNGFYIPTAIKQAWASCLDVLKEVDRVCTKYGIKYFADWGSFLGAVRHGGFVPWDDDLDICMLRDDYTKFRKVCDKELPKHYMIHDYERKEDHWLFLSRVVSNKSICFDEDYMAKHYNFPWLATVDIFIKDYIYMDEEKEKERDKEVMFLITLADGIREGTFDKSTALYHLQKVKEKYHISLPDIGRTRDLCVALYRLAEREMSRVEPEETDMVGQIFPWILKGGKGQPKAYYDKVIRLPFEDTTIPVPACYNAVLTSRYGNYNEIHKVWDGHMYPFFESQKADLEKINGSPIPDRVFDKNMLQRPEVDKSNSLKVIAKECLQELKKLYSELIGYSSRWESSEDKGLTLTLCDDTKNNTSIITGLSFSLEDRNFIENNLTNSQQLAIDLGTLIEQVKGEDNECTKTVVAALESYCEAIFQCFQRISGTDTGSDSDNSGDTFCLGTIYGKLKESLDRVCQEVKG